MARAVKNPDPLFALGQLLAQHLQRNEIALGDNGRTLLAAQRVEDVRRGELLCHHPLKRQFPVAGKKREQQREVARTALLVCPLLSQPLHEQLHEHREKRLATLLHFLGELLRRHIGVHHVGRVVVDPVELERKPEHVLRAKLHAADHGHARFKAFLLRA